MGTAYRKYPLPLIVVILVMSLPNQNAKAKIKCFLSCIIKCNRKVIMNDDNILKFMVLTIQLSYLRLTPCLLLERQVCRL